LTADNKAAWVVGYETGIAFAAISISDTKEGVKLLAFCPWKLSPGETVQAIDHFYGDTPENGPVAVITAVKYVALKASGATQSQLDDFASGARKASAP
jgi:hypothetical protein